MHKLESQVAALGCSLEKVKVLLDQKSPTVSEAKRVLKVCCEIFYTLLRSLLLCVTPPCIVE